jgi:hypothetical protein
LLSRAQRQNSALGCSGANQAPPLAGLFLRRAILKFSSEARFFAKIPV